MAAQYDIAIWADEVLAQVNPADAPSRAGGLSSSAEPSDDVASLGELFPYAISCGRFLSARRKNPATFYL